MKLSNVLNSALVFSAKRDVRYYLNAVNIYHKDDQVVAVSSTDGHTMQLLSDKEHETIELKDCENVIVSNEDVKRLIAIYHIDDVCEISVSELIDHIAPIETKYPDVTRVIPDPDGTCSGELVIGIDYKYLARVNASLTKLSKGFKNKFSHSKFTFGGPDKAIRVDTNIDCFSSLIIIMPCRM